VIEEIVVDTADEPPPQHVLRVHWKGGVHTELHVRRNGPGQTRHVTDETAIELLAELSKICDDATIAQVLNRLGYRTARAVPGACITSRACGIGAGCRITGAAASGSVWKRRRASCG